MVSALEDTSIERENELLSEVEVLKGELQLMRGELDQQHNASAKQRIEFIQKLKVSLLWLVRERSSHCVS